MIPLPSLLTRSGLLSRLMMQLAASALLTIFYTPGGAGGWVLDLVLRGYFAVARRLSAPVGLAALVPVPVRARRPSALRLSNLVEK
jgi:hypothetical protein